jgi:hypothetical protein
MKRLLVVAAILGFSTTAPAAPIHCEREVSQKEKANVEIFREGSIEPAKAIERAKTLQCFKRILRELSLSGGQLKPLSAASIKLAWNDEGFEQTYVIGAHTLKVGKNPWEKDIVSRNIYYSVSIYREALSTDD